MKSLKFSAELVPPILSGNKTTTWRLWDDKDLKEGDKVLLIKRPELTVFAKAKLTKVRTKKFKDLDQNDKVGTGNEPNLDLQKMFSDYYKEEVKPDTPVTVVRFEIIKKL